MALARIASLAASVSLAIGPLLARTEPAVHATAPAVHATEAAVHATEAAVQATQAAVQASEPATQASEPAVQEVEVTGERPGPSLWRVSKGDHVLWLLGTLDPLPKRMTWRSREVEDVIAHADLVLASNPAVSVNVGPIAMVRLYLQWRRTRKIPEKENLRDWLPAPLYTRFRTVEMRFDPHDRSIEELRPLLAARRLYERAIDASDLTSRNDIQETVFKLARRHHVPVEHTSIRLEDPKGILTEAGEIPRGSEIGCLDATVARLETDLPAMRARARAWAIGDVDALRALPYPKQREVCTSAAATSPRIRALLDQNARDWQWSLETALATRASTLAMKPIYDLISPGGLLDQLRAKGYRVEGP